jgi:hypothetical protein
MHRVLVPAWQAARMFSFDITMKCGDLAAFSPQEGTPALSESGNSPRHLPLVNSIQADSAGPALVPVNCRRNVKLSAGTHAQLNS